MTPKNVVRKFVESCGWRVEDVERWVPGRPITLDFGGFADLIAYTDRIDDVLAIQVTTDRHHGEHITKATHLDRARIWARGTRRLFFVSTPSWRITELLENGWCEERGRGIENAERIFRG